MLFYQFGSGNEFDIDRRLNDMLISTRQTSKSDIDIGRRPDLILLPILINLINFSKY